MPQQRRKSQRRRTDQRPAPTRTLELTIDHLGAQGDGVALFEGERIYVPRTVPGDRIRAQVTGTRATSIEVLAEGADRTAPSCPHYAECGGCALQHVNEEAYRKHKMSQLRETLARGGMDVTDINAHWCEPRSRRRITLRARGRKETALLGYQARGSHKLTNIDQCPVMTDRLEASIPELRKLAHEMLAPGEEAGFAVSEHRNGIELAVEMDGALYEEKRLTLLQRLGEASGQLTFTCITVNGEPALMVEDSLEDFDGMAIAVPPGAFLQPSQEGEGVLIAETLKHAPQAVHGKALDLFAGCGTYALPLARHFEVVAYEGVPAQVTALTQGARRAQVKSLQAIRRDLFKEPLGDLELRKVDYVVLNPPRAGAREQALELAKSDVACITYVSCNPGTLARDGAELLKGGYKVKSLMLLDQFVWSAHSECVAVFEKS